MIANPAERLAGNGSRTSTENSNKKASIIRFRFLMIEAFFFYFSSMNVASS